LATPVAHVRACAVPDIEDPPLLAAEFGEQASDIDAREPA
jgi:hypothetical protein